MKDMWGYFSGIQGLTQLWKMVFG